MVATPCDLALSSTALPVPESRLTIIRAVTPLVIICSAMVWKAVLSFWAFWMSYWTLAALNASSRKRRSAVSQRGEDLLSGRITPILGVFLESAEPLPESSLQAVKPPVVSRPTAAMVRIPLRMCRVLSEVGEVLFCCVRQRISRHTSSTRPRRSLVCWGR